MHFHGYVHVWLCMFMHMCVSVLVPLRLRVSAVALRSIPHMAMDAGPGFESWFCHCPRPLSDLCGTNRPFL